MPLTEVEIGDPHAPAHNAEREAINALETALTNEIGARAAAISDEVDDRNAAISTSESGQVRDGDAAGGVLSGTYPNPGFASDMATQTELDAEIALARNGDNITSGTVADARIAGTIARDSEVSSAIATSESGQVRDGDSAGGVLSGTYPNPGFAVDMATQAELDALINANNLQSLKGVIDCSGNPNYPAADAGDTYVISVAGKIGGASGRNVQIGDKLLCLTDGTAAGTQAAVGANWNITQADIDGAVIGPASAGSGNLVRYDGSGGKLVDDSGVSIDTDGTLAANSDAKLATQKASKTYADTKLPSSYLDTDGTLAANSDTKVASQKATKTYADTKIPSSYLDTDATLAANSDTKVASQKATKAYVDSRIYLSTNKIATGLEIIPRELCVSNSAALSNQVLKLIFFTALDTGSVTALASYCGAQAMAGATLAKMALFSVDANDDGTLMAATTNDTALWATINTRYQKSISSQNIVRNSRYAFGFLVVGASTAVQMPCQIPSIAFCTTAQPRLVGQLGSQTDIPSSFTGSGLATTNTRFYGELI
jgi:hypothetical protein